MIALLFQVAIRNSERMLQTRSRISDIRQDIVSDRPGSALHVRLFPIYGLPANALRPSQACDRNDVSRQMRAVTGIYISTRQCYGAVGDVQH